MQIFEALLRRDGNLAQALMSAHLQGAESYWKGLIGAAQAEAAAAAAAAAGPAAAPAVATLARA